MDDAVPRSLLLIFLILAGGFFSGTETALSFPESLTEILSGALFKCENLTAVQMPSHMKRIGAYAFYKCERLTALRLPDGITEIPKNLCYGCRALTEITVPAGVADIGEYAFGCCSNLVSVTLPESLNCIGNAAFLGCISLREAVLPNGLMNIGEEAFYECGSLTALTIPECVRGIGASAFRKCRSLSVIRLHPDDPEIRRDYGKIEKLGTALEHVIGMFRSGNYGFDRDTNLKFPLLALHFLHPHMCELDGYIRTNLYLFMNTFVPEGAVWFVNAAAEYGFFTQNNIDLYIDLASECKQNEILMLLMRYKNENFGFADGRKLRL